LLPSDNIQIEQSKYNRDGNNKYGGYLKIDFHSFLKNFLIRPQPMKINNAKDIAKTIQSHPAHPIDKMVNRVFIAKSFKRGGRSPLS
jgi:hypothetical protein